MGMKRSPTAQGLVGWGAAFPHAGWQDRLPTHNAHLPAALRWPQLSSPVQISRQPGLSSHNLPPSLQESQETGRQGITAYKEGREEV